MDSALMKEGCRSYKQWGESMKKPMKWKPTDHQMEWWESLSMSKEQRAANSRRHKRQAQGALRKEYRALSDQVRHLLSSICVAFGPGAVLSLLQHCLFDVHASCMSHCVLDPSFLTHCVCPRNASAWFRVHRVEMQKDL